MALSAQDFAQRRKVAHEVFRDSFLPEQWERIEAAVHEGVSRYTCGVASYEDMARARHLALR
jgi:hypothetical protein